MHVRLNTWEGACRENAFYMNLNWLDTNERWGLLSLFKFSFSNHHLTESGREGDIFFGFDKPRFALGNCLSGGGLQEVP